MEYQENDDFCYWTFIEKYYPRYHNCSDILLSDILTRKLDGEEICIEDEEMIKNWDVKAELIELDKNIFSKALENYFKIVILKSLQLMKLSEKINFFEEILNQPKENYADTFKADILMFFDDDFSEDNAQLLFLNKLKSKEEIQYWIDKLTSLFVLKFDAEFETENDFIYDYLENG